MESSTVSRTRPAALAEEYLQSQWYCILPKGHTTLGPSTASVSLHHHFYHLVRPVTIGFRMKLWAHQSSGGYESYPVEAITDLHSIITLLNYIILSAPSIAPVAIARLIKRSPWSSKIIAVLSNKWGLGHEVTYHNHHALVKKCGWDENPKNIVKECAAQKYSGDLRMQEKSTSSLN